MDGKLAALEDLKEWNNTNLGIAISLLLILCLIACMTSFKASKMYEVFNLSGLWRAIQSGMGMSALKTMHEVFGSTTPPMHPGARLLADKQTQDVLIHSRSFKTSGRTPFKFHKRHLFVILS